MDQALSTSLTMFSEIFDSLPQAVAIIDNDGRYVYYNGGASKIDAYPAELALGNPLLDVYPVLDAESSTLLQALRNGKRYVNSMQTFVNAAGKIVHQRHTTLPLVSSSQQIVGAIEVANEVFDASDFPGSYDPSSSSDVVSADFDHGIVTTNKIMLSLIRQAVALAQAQVSVLICGETGTGKELFARLLHREGSRSDKPFVVLNCAAIPESLFESTMFGTVKGAFTGAEERKGILEVAHEGTLFLDEINSMPLSAQGKLLRVLQDGRFSRVGSNKELEVDVRVVAAANQMPADMIESGRVRADLLYRLDVGSLSIPPLRERRDDIPLLAQRFLTRYRGVAGGRVTSISPAAMHQLVVADWPGNVRMLENVIQRSLIQCRDQDELADVVLDRPFAPVENSKGDLTLAPPLTTTQDLRDLPFDEMIQTFERDLLVKLMNACQSVSEVSRKYKVPRTTLLYKLKKYGIVLKQHAS